MNQSAAFVADGRRKTHRAVVPRGMSPAIGIGFGVPRFNQPPEKRGRVGVYRSAHLHRLQLIGRLQERGYSSAGIRDLLTSWRDGDELTDVLGLSPDELVHLDEPGTPATLDQLVRLLPALVPRRLDDLLAVGLIDECGPDRHCVPSPSLLQVTVDALAAGYPPRQVLTLLTA